MRSLADSDEVFESACDLDEVQICIYICECIVCCRTYLMTPWKRVRSPVRYCVSCVFLRGLLVHAHFDQMLQTYDESEMRNIVQLVALSSVMDRSKILSSLQNAEQKLRYTFFSFLKDKTLISLNINNFKALSKLNNNVQQSCILMDFKLQMLPES